MDRIMLHMNATQGGAKIHPGAKTAHEHGLRHHFSYLVLHNKFGPDTISPMKPASFYLYQTKKKKQRRALLKQMIAKTSMRAHPKGMELVPIG